MISRILEKTGNRLLEFDPASAARLSRLEGKVFKLEFEVVDRELYLIPVSGGLKIRERWAGPVDIVLRGSPLAFAGFGLKQKGANRAFAEKRLVIEGDAELAQDLQALIREVDIDFEELLSGYVGDVAARQAGRGARALLAWAEDAAERLKEDVRDFTVEESRILAPRWRVEAFADDTDRLRADVERLEQRVERLLLRVRPSSAGEQTE